jgi:hypothetical protein
VSLYEKKQDECCIIIKAQPHRSSKYFETVCCAGIGRDGVWRRQYPVPFRNLPKNQKFGRWDWIEYDWVKPSDDLRVESQKVDPDSIVVKGKMTKAEQIKLLNPLVRSSFAESNDKGDSLTLIRPKEIKFKWSKKSQSDLESEASKHAELSRQLPMFGETVEDWDPSPYSFRLDWIDQDNTKRSHEMDDWETLGAYFRFERDYGEEKALEILREKYEKERFNNGLVLGFSTHKRRNATRGTENQWLLVGLLALPENNQPDMFLG